MAETIGIITNVKVASFLVGDPSEFDVGAITVKETSTGISWFFYMWLTHVSDPAVQRVLNAQRLALAREAAFRKLTVHAFNDGAGGNLFELTVDIP
jgi:hypothetical protein